MSCWQGWRADPSLRGRSAPSSPTQLCAALPAARHALGAGVPVAALITDFADGQIARRTSSVTRFGAQGDFLADAALWTWFVIRYENSRACVSQNDIPRKRNQ